MVCSICNSEVTVVEFKEYVVKVEERLFSKARDLVYRKAILSCKCGEFYGAMHPRPKRWPICECGHIAQDHNGFGPHPCDRCECKDYTPKKKENV